MLVLLARPARPDAPYWPGRRTLAFIDAVGWPVAWLILLMQLPQRVGIVGPVVVALAVLSAFGRARRAAWENHRYYFTTWRWGRFALVLVVVGLVMKVAMPG